MGTGFPLSVTEMVSQCFTLKASELGLLFPDQNRFDSLGLGSVIDSLWASPCFRLLPTNKRYKHYCLLLPGFELRPPNPFAWFGNSFQVPLLGQWDEWSGSPKGITGGEQECCCKLNPWIGQKGFQDDGAPTKTPKKFCHVLFLEFRSLVCCFFCELRLDVRRD